MKRIIIVGASSGIGYALAETFASRGVRVGLAARHTRALASLKQQYPAYVEYKAIDITRHTAPAHLLELIEKTGGMDIYIHASGIGYSNSDLDPEKETPIIETNAVGFARMLDTAYRYFRTNGINGQIAAITSVAGTKGIGQLSAYSASKAFGQAYMVALQQLSNTEGAGITLTDIRPGWVRTPLLPEGAQYPMMMQPSTVVAYILKALVKKHRVVTVDWRWCILSSLWRLIPDSLWVHIPYSVTLPDSKSPREDKPVEATSEQNVTVES